MATVRIVNRDRLPDVLRYGTSREIQVGVTQKQRIPDIGNTTYAPQQQIIFKPEYGPQNQYFLDVHEAYLTYNMNVSTPTSPNLNVAHLDYCTDALFSKLEIQMGQNIVENNMRYNKFSMLWNDIANFSTPFTVASSTSTVMTQYTPSGTVTGGATFTGTPATLTATSTTSSCLGKPTDIYYGKDPTKIRTGLGMITGTTYNLAWHLKSFILGKWADKFFPLFAAPMTTITLYTEVASTALVNPCTPVNANALATEFSYSMSNVKLHYTLLSMDENIRNLVGNAYISTSLIDVMNSTIAYYHTSQPLQQGQNNFLQTFQLPFTSLKQLIIVFERNVDNTNTNNYSLTNHIGGLQKLQARVGNINLPVIQMDLDNHPYEFYRSLAYGMGEPNFTNANFPVSMSVDTTTGIPFNSCLVNNVDSYPRCYVGNPITNNTLPTGGGYVQQYTASPSDFWNARCDAIFGSRGNTIWLVNLEDANLFDNHHQRGGLDVSGGKNITFEFLFFEALPLAVTMNIYALFDTHFSIEANTAEIIPAIATNNIPSN